jgi:hypothetical protein
MNLPDKIVKATTDAEPSLGAALANSSTMRTRITLTFVIVLTGATAIWAADPLPSWNDTAPKKAIIAFVEKVTNEGSPDFVKPEERIRNVRQ